MEQGCATNVGSLVTLNCLQMCELSVSVRDWQPRHFSFPVHKQWHSCFSPYFVPKPKLVVFVSKINQIVSNCSWAFMIVVMTTARRSSRQLGNLSAVCPKNVTCKDSSLWLNIKSPLTPRHILASFSSLFWALISFGVDSIKAWLDLNSNINSFNNSCSGIYIMLVLWADTVNISMSSVDPHGNVALR